MTLKHILAIFVIAIVLFCCKKEADEIVISGITERSIYCDLIGTVDTTDWRLDDSWSSREESLFKKRNEFITKSAQYVDTYHDIDPIITNNVIRGYPNPFVDYITLSFEFGELKFLDIRIVDKNFNLIKSYDDFNEPDQKIVFDSTIERKQVYRIYYKVYTSFSIYRGHGDVFRN